MHNRIGLAATLLLLTLAAGVFGRDGLGLMKIETGARPFGMGGAFVSIAGDPNVSFYNPAGAVGAGKFTASLGHNTHWENIRIETGYFISKFTDRSWIHGGIRYAAVDDIEARTRPTAQPEAVIPAYDISFKSGLTYTVTDKLSAGMSLGWFVKKIDIERGSTFNVDLGLHYRAAPRLDVGVSVTNLGSDFSLAMAGQPGTDKISIPTTYRAGASYQHGWGISAVDMVIIDDDFHLHLGAEAELHEYALLRAGYMVNYDSKSFTAGTSFKRRNFTVDYAFVPYSNNLGTSHLFNLTFTL